MYQSDVFSLGLVVYRTVRLADLPAMDPRPGTLVLEGTVRVEHEGGVLEVAAGQAVRARAGEWVRYSTPGGARYVAVCLPAFAPDTVHRDG